MPFSDSPTNVHLWPLLAFKEEGTPVAADLLRFSSSHSRIHCCAPNCIHLIILLLGSKISPYYLVTAMGTMYAISWCSTKNIVFTWCQAKDTRHKVNHGERPRMICAQFRFKSCHLEVFTNFLNLGVSVCKSGIIWSMSLGSPDD